MSNDVRTTFFWVESPYKKYENCYGTTPRKVCDFLFALQDRFGRDKNDFDMKRQQLGKTIDMHLFLGGQLSFTRRGDSHELIDAIQGGRKETTA